MSYEASAQKITARVLSEYGENLASPRLAKILESLVVHLHQFAIDVELTEAEWFSGIDFLRRTGQLSDEKRNELILLSDVLGLSMIVDAINSGTSAGATESTVIGPFYVPGAPDVGFGGSLIRTPDSQGEELLVTGQVLSDTGTPIPDASMEVWSTSGSGSYFVQDETAPAFNLYGSMKTNSEGAFCFKTEMPVSYPVPVDGPVGELLNATTRTHMRPAHLHFIITAEGFAKLQTHLFPEDDPFLGSDAVFALKDELIAAFKPSENQDLAREYKLPAQFRHLEYDFLLSPLT